MFAAGVGSSPEPFVVDSPYWYRRLRELIPRRDELVELLRLAFPVATVQVGMMLMGVVDTIMVGHVSPVDLAAVALGNLYFFSASVFGLGTLLALDPLVSQAVGAADREGIARSVQRGAVLAVLLAIGAAAVLAPAGPVLALLGQPPDVVPIAAGYVHAALLGVLPFYLYVVLRQTLQAIGRVGLVVVTMVAANLANVAFNWVMVFGNLGFPAMGAVGAGWASTLSRVVMTGALFALAWPTLRPFARPLRTGTFRSAPLLRMLTLGAPIGGQLLLEFGAFAVIGVLMGWLGTTAMAGHQVAINLASLTFMVPLGVAQATTVLVGRSVGGGDPPGARRAAGAGLMVGALFMVGTAILFLTVPEVLARAYTADRAVQAIAVVLIPVAGVFQVFDGLQVVGTAVLRGVGDTRVPMIVHVLGFWLVGFPVSLVIGFRLGGGPEGLWWGLVAGLAAVAVLLLARIRYRFARDLPRLIVHEDD